MLWFHSSRKVPVRDGTTKVALKKALFIDVAKKIDTSKNPLLATGTGLIPAYWHAGTLYQTLSNWLLRQINGFSPLFRDSTFCCCNFCCCNFLERWIIKTQILIFKYVYLEIRKSIRTMNKMTLIHYAILKIDFVLIIANLYSKLNTDLIFV